LFETLIYTSSTDKKTMCQFLGECFKGNLKQNTTLDLPKLLTDYMRIHGDGPWIRLTHDQIMKLMKLEVV